MALKPANPAQLVGRWRVPLRGVRRNLPIEQIPEDALYLGQDVIVRGGKLTVRPGLTQFASTTLTGRPTGAYNTSMLAAGAFQPDAFQNDAFQVSSSLPTTALIVGTTRKLYTYFGGVFNDITGGSDLSAFDSELARFTSIQFGSPPTIYIVHVNGRDVPRQWDSTSGSFSNVAGNPPVFSDVATIGQHVIGIVPPYSVRWGNSNALDTWPGNNFYPLSDTTDPVIAIRNLGLLGGVVYKQRSIWAIVAQGGTEAGFFRFEYRGSTDGPASPAAVVDAGGVHLYMTDTGRVGKFDGFNHEWVADGLWPVTQAALDPANANRIHAVYNSEHYEVYFYYPRVGDAGDCKGIAVVKLPRVEENIAEPIGFSGVIGKAVSASVDLRMDSKKAVVFTSTTPKAYTVEGGDDAGVSIAGFWQTGLVETGGRLPSRADVIEVFAERAGGYGTVNVRVVSSNLLETPGGTLSSASTLDLTAASRVADPIACDARGRFLGLRFEFTTPLTLNYRGAAMSALDRDMKPAA